MRMGRIGASANDSVTSVPSPAAASSYRHVLTGLLAEPTPNANSRPGSLAITVQVVQYVGPRPFRFTWPRNRAPTAGSVAPSSHPASNVSGLYRPILVTSLTKSQTCPGG